MLRAIVIGVVSVLLGLALIVVCRGASGAIGPAVVLSLLLIALVFEAYQYRRPKEGPPGGPFRATDEKFIDPDSGKLVQVYSDPSTGARRYVTVGNADDAP